jgi:RNA polymerase sigma-70 factor (ECF subfamily)
MSATGDLSYGHAIQRSGDAAALASSLFTRHHRSIERQCACSFRSKPDAEDALQQTFLNALQALQAGVRPRNEMAWLLQIARNVCLERQRNAGRRARLETATSPDSLEQLAAAPENSGTDQASQIRAALARLEPRQREALLLREWRGLSYKETATVLQLSQSAVEALLFRARRSLGRALEDGRRLRSGLNLGGIVANLRALLPGSAAKTAAIVACCGATIVSVPTLEHALTQGHKPAGMVTPARPAPPASGTNNAIPTNVQTRTGGTIDRSPGRGSEASGWAAGTGSNAAPPATGGTGAGSTVSGPDTVPGAVPGGAGNIGATAATPADKLLTVDPPAGSVDGAAGEGAIAVDAAVGGSTGVGADVSVNASGSEAGASATVSTPDGTSASTSVTVSDSQASASADASAPGDASASATVDNSGTSVTADVPAIGVSTNLTLPLP